MIRRTLATIGWSLLTIAFAAPITLLILLFLLHNKWKSRHEPAPQTPVSEAQPVQPADKSEKCDKHQLVKVLMAMGYKKSEARRAAAQATGDNLQEQIKSATTLLAKNKGL